MSEDECLKIVEEWQQYWMSKAQNPPEEEGNYRRRALGIDANMRYHLAKMIAARQSERVGELERFFGPTMDVLCAIAGYGPAHGEEPQRDIACAFCDMGHAGYSSRGDGFHDDNCAVKDAQLILRGKLPSGHYKLRDDLARAMRLLERASYEVGNVVALSAKEDERLDQWLAEYRELASGAKK